MIVIRAAHKDDTHACDELFRMGEEDSPDGYEGATVDYLHDALEDGRTLVADENGRIVGMVSVLHGMIAMLVCDREHRGGKLAPDLITEAKEIGGRTSIIKTHALPSFERAGFKKVGYFVEVS